jgi:hypothetical protein
MDSLKTSILLTIFAIGLLGSPAFAKKGGNPGGGGGGEDPPATECQATADFPFVLYSVDTGNGDRELVMNASDGCSPVPIVDPATDANPIDGFIYRYRLEFDGSSSGSITWAEVDVDTGTGSQVRTMAFDVSGTDVTFQSPVVLYTSPDFAWEFDVAADRLVIADGESVYLVELMSCATAPCTSNDGTLIYSMSGATCRLDPIGGCYRDPIIAVAPGGDWLYMTLRGDADNPDTHPQAADTVRVNILARVNIAEPPTGTLQESAVLLNHDDYGEKNEVAVSPDGQKVAFGTDYWGLMILEFLGGPSSTDFNVSELYTSVRRLGTWTSDDTLLILEDAGSGRKLVHQIKELNPVDGSRRDLGIILQDNPTIDSAL